MAFQAVQHGRSEGRGEAYLPRVESLRDARTKQEDFLTTYLDEQFCFCLGSQRKDGR